MEGGCTNVTLSCFPNKPTGSERIWVCAVCLSTNGIHALDPITNKWLSNITECNEGVRQGACARCAGGLRRAAKVVGRVLAAQDVLRGVESEELNLKWLSKYSEENHLVALTTKHLGANHFDYEFDDNGRTTVILKKEIDTAEVKTENVEEWNEGVSDDAIIGTNNFSTEEPILNYEKIHLNVEKSHNEDSNDSDSNLPIVNFKRKKVTEKKVRKSKLTRVKSQKGDDLTAAKKSQLETDAKLKEYYEIEKLSSEQQREEVLKRKESANYLQSELKCELCYKGFTNTKAFESHMVGHSDKMGRYKCPICHLNCASNSYVGKHINNQHRYRYTCRLCTAVFKYRTAAKMHINWHQGKKYVCDICGQEFEHQNSCLGHKRIKHPSEDHVCNLCGFSFLNQKGVNYHRARKHALDDDSIPPDGPECAPCGIRFKNADALSAHRRVSPRHGECVRNEPGRPAEPTKKPREPIACEQCGKQMSSLRGYSAHFAKFHPTSTRTVFPRDATPSLCTVCGKTFKNPKNMQFHARSHSARWRYECEICHKVFKRKDFKLKHVNIHTNEKKYPCHVCGKTFNHAGNRDRHLLVHSAKDCKCDLCDKCFKSEKEVEIHVKYVHLKTPYPKRRRKDARRPNRDMFLDSQ